MKRRVRLLLGSVVVVGTGLCAGTALAQFHPDSEDVQLYAGEMYGDRLTETSISGALPRFNDSLTYGARYTFNFTPRWGLQLSGAYSPGRASHVANGSTDLDLTTTDLDLIFDITPDLSLAGHKLVTYVVGGGGYAWANLDGLLAGSAGGTPVTLKGGNGVTANAGVGVKYYFNDRFFIDLDTRYRYLHRLLTSDYQGLNTAETTLGLGYQF